MSVLLFIGATWLFAGIAEDVVTGDPLIDADRKISAWFHAHATPALTWGMLLVTNTHGTIAISIMGLAFGLYLWRRRLSCWLVTLAFVLPGGMLLNVLLKQIFRRDRPSLDTALLSLSTYSFPSGHVTGATLFYGLLAAFLASRVPAWGSRAAIFLFAGCIVIMVGISRIYLGVHYFSDVERGLGGHVAGRPRCVATAIRSLKLHPPPEIP